MSEFPLRPLDKLSLEGLQSEIGHLLRRWWHCGLSTGPLDGQDWAPPVEVRDEPGCYRVLIELPGVDRAGLSVTVQPGGLVVCGEKRSPLGAASPGDDVGEPAGGGSAAVRVVQTERRYGRFRRVIDLPGAVRPEAATAMLASGVLEVTLPKAAEAGPEGVRLEIRTPDAEPGPSTAAGG